MPLATLDTFFDLQPASIACLHSARTPEKGHLVCHASDAVQPSSAWGHLLKVVAHGHAPAGGGASEGIATREACHLVGARTAVGAARCAVAQQLAPAGILQVASASLRHIYGSASVVAGS